MSYFAVALAKSEGEWHGAALDLSEIESLEDIADATTDLGSDDGQVYVLIDADNWFGVVTTSNDEDPRPYVSDAFEAADTAVGEVLVAEFGELTEGDDETEAELGVPPGPLGEPGLLDAVGVGAADLEVIATKTGLTPLDAVAEIAQRIGAGAAFEDLR